MNNHIFILNGPNLNLLGVREPSVYGRATLEDVRAQCLERAATFGDTVDFRQTNHEGTLVDWVQEAAENAHALVINPAAYGHTSIALHDALKVVPGPIIEVHLSQPAAREPFRGRSYVTSLARGLISGLGALSYVLGVDAACRLAAERST